MFPFYHLKSSKLNTYLHKKNGTEAYALITGATDGIGLGFANELLAAGFNVLLHGRNPTKLAKVQSDLQRSFPGRKIHTLVADAAHFQQSDIDQMVASIQAIENMNLTILINNVGGAGVLKANFQTFSMHTTEEITALVNLNILFTIQLTHALLPLLKAHGTKSLIMNIGSQAHVGAPFMPVYGGTKGMIHAWSRGLAAEEAPFASHIGSGNGEKNAHAPIEVLEILVASVQTQQNQTAKPTLFVPSAQTMARAALDRVGCGERHGVAAYWPHAVQGIFMGLLPNGMVDRLFVTALKDVVGKEERVW